MATTNISGIGSGIDFGAITDSIVAERSRPVVQLQSRASNYTTRIDSLKKLNASLAALSNATEALTSKTIGTGRNASSTDASILTTTATSSASIGQFDVNITRLATSLSQQSRTYLSQDAAVLANGATTATFELRKGGASSGVPITIDGTNNTLAGLRDAINGADAGVIATIVDVHGDGTDNRLVLASTATGSAGRVELVETTATGTGADVALSTINPVDQDIAKLDAVLTLNGIGITRSSNTVSDLVTGVTINLKKTGAVSVQVSQSTEIRSKLQNFVDAFNGVQDFIAAQYQKDATGRPTGVLAGDSTLRNVQDQLRTAINASSSTNGGGLSNLTQIGLGRDDKNHLTIDDTVYTEKIKNSATDVRALLVGRTDNDSGLSTTISSAVSALSDGVTGTVQNAITGYQTSITAINKSVTSRLEFLDHLRTSLTKQFSEADAAIGVLNGQNTALTNLLKTLSSSGK
jgi:flagellar hook-associated protein 2